MTAPTLASFVGPVRWYRNALGRNPLIRPSDRIEACVTSAALAIAAVSIPVAIQAGHDFYDTRMRTAAEHAQTRHPVEADVLVGNSGLPVSFEGSGLVFVKWVDGQQARTAEVVSPATVRAGDTFTIWLDEAGTVVPAPMTTTDARVGAILGSGTAWAFVITCTALAVSAVRRRLDRHRAVHWDEVLQALTRD